MHTVTMFKGFKKRINSTKRPSGGTQFPVNFKVPTDLHRPTVRLNTTEQDFNYMLLEGKYFYIVNVVVTPTGWVEYTGDPDAMATCADDIKATRVFLERSNSLGSTTILDSYSPATASIDLLLSHSAAMPWPFAVGSYVVSFTNLLQPAVMLEGEIQALYQKLNDPSIFQQLKDLLTGGIKDFITGAMWLPVQVPRGGSTGLYTNSVPLGIDVSLLLMRYDVGTVVVEFPDLDASAWNSSAYCDVNMYLPFAGNAQLSLDTFKHSRSMEIQIGIDYSNGGIVYIVHAGSAVVATFNGSCGVSVGIGYSGSNMASAVGGGLISAIGTAVGSPQISLAGAGIFMGGVHGATGQLSAAAGNKAFAMDTNIQVSVTRRNVPESYSNKKAVVGLPTYKTTSLGSVSGFVKCINATIESEHLELAEVCNSYLNSGAWIE